MCSKESSSVRTKMWIGLAVTEEASPVRMQVEGLLPVASPAWTICCAAAQKSGVPRPGVQAKVGDEAQLARPQGEAFAKWYAVPPGASTTQFGPVSGYNASHEQALGELRVTLGGTGLSTGVPAPDSSFAMNVFLSSPWAKACRMSTPHAELPRLNGHPQKFCPK